MCGLLAMAKIHARGWNLHELNIYFSVIFLGIFVGFNVIFNANRS